MLKGYQFTRKGVVVFLVGSFGLTFFITIATRIAIMQYQHLNSQEISSEKEAREQGAGGTGR